MRMRSLRLLLAGLGAALLLAGAAAASAAAPAPEAATDPLIVISNFAYSGDLTVSPGVTVTVRNDDAAPHTLTAVDGTFTTPVIQPGTTATFVAPTAEGSYPIKCQIHAFMSGTLTVSAGGPASPTPSEEPSQSPSESPSPVPTSASPTPAPSASSPAPGNGGCTVMYDVVAQWPGGFEAIVMVMNGAAARTSWTVSWTFAGGQTISQIWSGTANQNGSAVTVQNASYNGVLAAGASTQFGFLGTWNGSNAVPTGMTCQ